MSVTGDRDTGTGDSAARSHTLARCTWSQQAVAEALEGSRKCQKDTVLSRAALNTSQCVFFHSFSVYSSYGRAVCIIYPFFPSA